MITVKTLSCSAVALVLTLAARAVCAQPVEDAESNEARESFRRGVVALRAGRNVDAVSAFERSLALRDYPVVRYNLGLAYRASGRNVAAIEEFERYLASGDPSATPERVQVVRDEVTQLRRSLAALHLTVSPASATIFIDGRPSSAGPSWLLDPGQHVFEFRADGYQPAREVLTLSAGSTRDMEIRLQTVGVTQPAVVTVLSSRDPMPLPVRAPAPRAVIVRREPETIAPVVLLVAGAATAGVALTINTALWATGNGIEADYRARCGASRSSACQTDWMQTQRALDARAGAMNALWVLGGLGVISAGVGAGWLIVRGGEREGVLRGPRITPTLGGLSVSGRF